MMTMLMIISIVMWVVPLFSR